MTTKLPMLACLASTLFMTGVIWFVHVVHYPLFDRVGADGFRAYHAAHTRTTGYVVIVPMIVELASAAWLVASRPEGTGSGLAGLGLGLAIMAWGVTFASSVPSHGRLALGFDPEAHRSLVRMNALRVVAWTGHSLVCLAMTARAIR